MAKKKTSETVLHDYRIWHEATLHTHPPINGSKRNSIEAKILPKDTVIRVRYEDYCNPVAETFGKRKVEYVRIYYRRGYYYINASAFCP